MPNNTPTYWSASGESLHTFAKSISTLEGLLKPPPVRGENQVIPYRVGRRYVPKVPDEQVLNMSAWVRGIPETGGAGAYGATANQFDENWNNLVRLLFTPGKQFPLTKRFYDGGVLRSATALAEYSGGMAPTMMGRNGAKFLVDLLLADPYFYDDSVQSFTLVNGDQNLVIRGNAPTTNILLTINGARTNPIVRVKSPAPDHQVQFFKTMVTGDQVVIDSRNYTALMDPNSGPNYDAETDVRHSGAPYWLQLSPGTNVVNLSSSSGAGTVTLQVRGAWI